MSRKAAIAALVLSAAIAMPATAKPLCYKPSEVKALQFRQLQVELMVAALKCRSMDPSFQDKYASYVGKVGPQLNRNAQELRAMFVRHGKGAAYIDRFMTDLSNQASMRSLHVEDYCPVQEKIFDQVLTMETREVEAFAAATVENPASAGTCPPPVKKAEAGKAKLDVKAKAPAGSKS